MYEDILIIYDNWKKCMMIDILRIVAHGKDIVLFVMYSIFVEPT